MATVIAVAVSGCGWSETKFEVKTLPLLCEEAAACAGTFEATACVDELRSSDRTSCDYDPESARDCHKAIEDAGCVPDALMDTQTLEVPEACHATYSCEWIDLAPF